jgi:hypothetical protein
MESWLVRVMRERVVIGLLRGMERQHLKAADWRPPLLVSLACSPEVRVVQRGVSENRPELAK